MYPNPNQALAGQGVIAGRETPVLVSTGQRIEKTLMTCHELISRMEAACDRLVNPSPRAVPARDAAPTPPRQPTVEAQYSEIEGGAQSVMVRLGDLAERLDRAA